MPSCDQTTALILCGGLGTRLRPALGDVPKVLARVGEATCLDHQLCFLRSQGVRDVVLCTGHAAEQVEAHAQTAWSEYLHLRMSREPAALGTGGAIRHAASLPRSDPFLVLNGDSFLRVELRRLLEFHDSRRAALTVVVVQVPDQSRFGGLEVDAAGAVTAFREKERKGPGSINAGLYVMNEAVAERIPEGRPVSLEREIFPQLLGQGLYAYDTPGPFLDIGTPESYAQAAEFLKRWSEGTNG